MNPKYLRALLAVVLAVFAGVATLQAKSKQAEKYFKQGQAAELKNDWDNAVAMYQKASDESPTDLNYQIAVRRARFQGGQKHVENGVKLRGEEKIPEAVQEFQKAIVIDPSSAIAVQELKRTQQMALDRQRQGASSVDLKGLTDVERARKISDARVAALETPPEIKPTLKRLPVPTKLNQSTPQLLYRSVAAMAGVYVVFDPTYQAPGTLKPIDLELDGMTVEQAFDMIAFVTKTFWKPISGNTIFVCEDSTTKRRDFEDDVVRVFYVPNAASVQEFVEIANGIRTVTEIRRLFTYNAARAIMVRDTADKVAMVEKLVHDLDKPKSEVIVDVMIMEANSTRSRQLAATIASGGTAGLNLPIAFSPRSSITVGGTTTTTTSSTTTGGVTTSLPGTTTTPASTGSSVALSSLSHIATADFSTSLPGALLEAMLTDTKTKVLNQPQVRASDGMKVELKVGLRVPYATGSLGSAVGATTAGVSPLVQTQFNYVDTGVTLVITPQVHSSDELTMHVEITVASVQQYENLGGGLSQPVIAQEQNITDVRMRNNEVSLLGGLNQTTDALTTNGIPGLSSLPVLGKFLFGSQSTEKDSDQILIAMIPHIVRGPDYSAENFRNIFSGSENNAKMVHAPPPDEPDAPAPAAVKPAAVQTAPETPATPASPVTPVAPGQVLPAPVAPTPGPAAAPVPAPPAPAPVPIPTPAAPIQNSSSTPPAAPNPAVSNTGASPPIAAAGLRLSFLPGPVQVKADGSFTLTVQLDGASNVASVAPLNIKFDPTKVRLDDATAGEMLKHGGAKVATIREIRNDAGEATLTVTRAPESGGVSGSGAVAMLSFSAIGKGTGNISIADASVKNTQSQPQPAELSSVPVTVE